MKFQDLVNTVLLESDQSIKIQEFLESYGFGEVADIVLAHNKEK